MGASKLPLDGRFALLQRVDPQVVWAWLLGFLLILYLGLEGGGFDPLVHDKVGIVVWWVILATSLVGALPRRRLAPLAWCGLGLFAAFVVWTALSLSWTESVDSTSADLARVGTYLGVFALALFARDERTGRHIVAGVGAAIAVVAVVGLLSRLQPDWFPAAGQTATLVSVAKERLSYPLDYWNGLAALIAIGLPAVFQVATCAKSLVVHGLFAAALPAMVLALFFTLSRAGMVAAGIALVIFLALSSDRLPKLLLLAVAGAGSAVLVAAAASRHSLQHGLLDATAKHQGNQILIATVVICVLVGLAQVGLSLWLRRRARPAWTIVSRRQSLALLLAGALVAVVLIAALNVPGRASSAWSDFKRNELGTVKGVGRFGSFAGENRYQFWSAAVKENRSKPLTGTGSGTFQFWWAREGDTRNVVHDAHSLYLQTLGELGLVGFVLLVAFLLLILIVGLMAAIGAEFRERPHLAAAVAGCFAFCGTAAFDWTWQIPVLPVSLLVLASAIMPIVSARRPGSTSLPLPPRLGIAIAAIAAITAISIPLSSTSLVRESQADAAAGDLTAALDKAVAAQNAQPDAAAPRLQQALLLEEQGDLPAASLAARGATDRESTNWRNWLVLSRIEAERGRVAPALDAYREAKSLNPRSLLFSG
jgi:hypothetical protein